MMSILFFLQMCKPFAMTLGSLLYDANSTSFCYTFLQSAEAVGVGGLQESVGREFESLLAL